MTVVKVIVALASALVFAAVGLVACGTDTTRSGYVSTPTFTSTTGPAALIVLDHPVPVTVTRTVQATVRAAPQVAVQAPAPRPAPITVTRIVQAPVRTSATSRASESHRPVAQAFSYSNCDQARADGVAPLRKGQAGYARKLDRDGDGIACEAKR
jgi:hypothetical protein